MQKTTNKSISRKRLIKTFMQKKSFQISNFFFENISNFFTILIYITVRQKKARKLLYELVEQSLGQILDGLNLAQHGPK